MPDPGDNLETVLDCFVETVDGLGTANTSQGVFLLLSHLLTRVVLQLTAQEDLLEDIAARLQVVEGGQNARQARLFRLEGTVQALYQHIYGPEKLLESIRTRSDDALEDGAEVTSPQVRMLLLEIATVRLSKAVTQLSERVLALAREELDTRTAEMRRFGPPEIDFSGAVDPELTEILQRVAADLDATGTTKLEE